MKREFKNVYFGLFLFSFILFCIFIFLKITNIHESFKDTSCEDRQKYEDGGCTGSITKTENIHKCNSRYGVHGGKKYLCKQEGQTCVKGDKCDDESDESDESDDESDDENWRYAGNSKKDCGWVANDPYGRCFRQDEDGLSAFDACKSSCKEADNGNYYEPYWESNGSDNLKCSNISSTQCDLLGKYIQKDKDTGKNLYLDKDTPASKYCDVCEYESEEESEEEINCDTQNYEIISLKEQIDNKIIQIETLNNEINTIKDEYDSEMNELKTNHEKELDDKLEKQLINSEETCDKKIGRKKDKIEELEKEIEGVEGDCKDKLDKCDEKLRLAKNEIKSLEKNINNLKEDKEKLKDKLKKRKDEYTETLNALEITNTNIKNKVIELEDIIEKNSGVHQEEIERLKKEIERLKREYKKIKTLANKLRNDIIRLQNVITAKNKQITNLINEKNRLWKVIQKERTTNTKLRGIITDNQKRIKRLNEIIVDRNNTIKRMKEQMKNLKIIPKWLQKTNPMAH